MFTPQESYMKRALQLAAYGAGFVSPNPMVGAVIVAPDGRIIGQGWHRKYGGPHAEVNAVNSVIPKDQHLLRESTIYVTLEPCSHYGKTPPCSLLLINKGLKRVVVGSPDPFPLVAGRGVKMLREAGIEVIEGFMQEECDFLNRRFITAHTLHRPWILLKWAQSADGFMAALSPENPAHIMNSQRSGCAENPAESFRNCEGRGCAENPAESFRNCEGRGCAENPAESFRNCEGRGCAENPAESFRNCEGRGCAEIPVQFSSPISSALMHTHRALSDAILVGTHTILIDNPSLTTRHWPGRSPRPVTFNSTSLHTETNGDFSLLNRPDLILLNPKATLDESMHNLYQNHGITSLMVEGGPDTLRRFIQAGLYDAIRIEIAPILLGTGLPAPKIPINI